MQNKSFIYLLRYGAIAGNFIFILWISYNAIKEGFRGTLPEKVSYIGLMGLLAVNTFFLLYKPKKNFLNS